MNKFLLAVALCVPLMGCEGFFKSPTVQNAAVSSTTTSPIQATSLKAAGEFYTIVTHAATAALEAGYVDKATAVKMKEIEGQLFAALQAGDKANQSGNSPAAAAALATFNANYAKLAALIPGLH